MVRKRNLNYLNSIDPVFVYMGGITIIFFTISWLVCDIFTNTFIFHNFKFLYISIVLWFIIMINFLTYMVYLEDKKGEN